MGWQVAFAGLQAGASILGGMGQARAARSQAAQQLRQAEAARTQGLEKEASLRDEFNRTMSTFAAARGANGLTLNSPSGVALASDLRLYSRQNIQSLRRNTAMQAAGLTDAAQGTMSQGRYSLLTGVFNAAPSLASMAQGMR